MPPAPKTQKATRLQYLPTEILVEIFSYLFPDDISAMACTIPRLAEMALHTGVLARFGADTARWSKLEYHLRSGPPHPVECLYVRMAQDLTELIRGEAYQWYYPRELVLEGPCFGHYLKLHDAEGEIDRLAKHSRIIFGGVEDVWSRLKRSHARIEADELVGLALEMLPNLSRLVIPDGGYYFTDEVLRWLTSESPANPPFRVAPLQHLRRVEVRADTEYGDGLDVASTFLQLPALEHLQLSRLKARATRMRWPGLIKGHKLKELILDDCQINCYALERLLSQIPALQKIRSSYNRYGEHLISGSFSKEFGLEAFHQVLLTYTRNTLEHLDIGNPMEGAQSRLTSLCGLTHLRTVKLPAACLPITTRKAVVRGRRHRNTVYKCEYCSEYVESRALAGWLLKSIEAFTIRHLATYRGTGEHEYVLPMQEIWKLLE